MINILNNIAMVVGYITIIGSFTLVGIFLYASHMRKKWTRDGSSQ